MKKYIVALLLLLTLVLAGCTQVTKSRNTDTSSSREGKNLETEEKTKEAVAGADEGTAQASKASEENIESPVGEEVDKIESSQEEMSLEDIIVKTKGILNIGSEFDEVTTEESSQQGSNKFYTVNYFNTSNNESAWFSTDIYGNIINFGRYGEEEYNLLADFNKMEAEKKVRNLLIDLYGEIGKDFLIQDNSYYNSLDYPSHNFNVVRVVNGIKVPSDNIYIEISKNTMNIVGINVQTQTNYNFADGSIFDDINDIKSEDEAFEAYKKNNKIYKSLLAIEEPSKGLYAEYKYKPTYAMFDNQIPIDAKTLEANYMENEYQMAYGDYSKDALAEEAGLSDAEQEQIDNKSKQRTVSEAEDKARELFDLKDYKLTYSNLSNYYRTKDVYVWYLNFSDSQDKNISVSLLAEDLSLLEYSNYTANISKNSKQYSDKTEEYINTGNDFLVSKAGMSKDDLLLTERSKNLQSGSTHTLKYVREIKDGIYSYNDVIYININKTENKVDSFSKSWNFNKNFGDYKFIIEEDEAYNLLKDTYNFELIYKRVDDSKDSKVKLYYELSTDEANFYKEILVDAENGQVIDMVGQPIGKNQGIEYSDLDLATDPNLIKTLAENNIGYLGGELRASESINQIQLFRLFASSYVYNTHPDNLSNEEIYNLLEHRNLLGNEGQEPEKIITNRDYAKYIARYIGYEDIAQLNEIFKDKYEDVTSENPDYGYLVLAKEKGLINNDTENLLEPDKEIDRESALYYYYRLKMTSR